MKAGALPWETQARREPLLRRDGYGQPLPSFGTSALDDKATVLGGHTDEKTVRPFPGGIAWLKSSFHDECSCLRSFVECRRKLYY